MGMKYGLEKEYFVIKNGQNIKCPSELPHDECGYLAEARGKPYENIREAVFSLMAEESRLKNIARKIGVTLSDKPVMKLPRNFILDVSRHFAKGKISYENLYGFQRHKNNQNEYTAGVHISFTDGYKVIDKDNENHTINQNFDWVKIFRYLDTFFAKEIKDSKRNIGFYEIKYDGRIEYRSLPSNIDLMKVIECLENYK